MATLLPEGKQSFQNSAGVPLIGGKLYTYDAGTSTPRATYSDAAGTVPNTNPVVLDARGEATIFWNGAYKVVLKDASDVTIWTTDNVVSADTYSLAGIAALLVTLLSSIGSTLIGFIQGGAGAVLRTVQAKARERVSVLDFGADPTGVVSASTAFALASTAGQNVVIPKGTYLVSTDLTFTVPVTMEYGAVITIPTGITLTFNGGFDAGVYQTFACVGTGAVVFNASKRRYGYAEWWGAVTGGPDCTTAINAALIALRKTQLMPADYWTTSRLLMGLPFRELAGSGYQFDGVNSNFVTRILLQSGTADILQVGPDVFPGSVNALYKENYVHDIYLVRTIAPVVTTPSNGLKNIYTLYAKFENVKSEGSVYGFQFYGTVQTYVNRCFAFRQTAGTGGADIFYGFYVNGAAAIGLNSGNASLYLNYCNASIGGISIANSNGFYADSGFTDLFLESPESSGCAIGVNIQGDGSAVSNLKNIDLHINNPILDAFTYAGLLLNNINKFGAVTVTGGYYGAAAGASAGLYITNSNGAVVISGGQVHMNYALTGHGMVLVACNGVIVRDIILSESRASGIECDSITNCTLAPVIKNYTYSPANPGIRVFSTTSRNIYAPTIYGGSLSFPLGVQLVGAGHSYSEINCSGIDSAALAGGSGGKLNINGVSIVATGLSATNLVSGVMA